MWLHSAKLFTSLLMSSSRHQPMMPPTRLQYFKSEGHSSQQFSHAPLQILHHTAQHLLPPNFLKAGPLSSLQNHLFPVYSLSLLDQLTHSHLELTSIAQCLGSLNSRTSLWVPEPQRIWPIPFFLLHASCSTCWRPNLSYTRFLLELSCFMINVTFHPASTCSEA